MEKRIDKKIFIILVGLVLLAAGFSYAVYAAGVVFFGGSAAQTVVSFTTVGTTSWTVPDGVTSVEVLTVAGGGGGGMDMGGGGGGGGVVYNGSYSVTPGSNVTVIVGAGGNGAPAANTDGQPGGHQYTISATNGQNSVFGTITAIGGGYGGSSYYQYTPNYGLGGIGGSGGGSSGYTNGATTIGAAGTAGQGFKGGNAGGTSYASGGGGGAGGSGADGPNQANGGSGILYSSISSYYFGGGGGGAAYTLATGGNGGIGGGGGGAIGTTYGGAGLNNGAPGGGGNPNDWGNRPGGNAGANTGGGGGGGSHYNANNKGGDGGSGIVVIIYGKAKMAVSSIEKGLVGHWALDGDGYNASTGRVTDKTPYENHGTNYGATLTTDRMGQANGAMSFDGSSGYINVGRAVVPVGGNNYTVSTWFYANGVPSGFRELMAQWTYANSGNSFYLGFSDDNIRFSDSWQSADIGTWTANAWHNLTAVSTTNNAYIYLDGQLKATKGSSLGYSGSGPLIMGRQGEINGEYFSGSISDVRVYNRALSATEVTTLYGAYKPKVTTGSLQQGLILDMPLTSSYTKTVTAGSEIMTDRTPYSRDGQNSGAMVGSDSSNFVEESDVVSVPGAFLNNLPQITESAWINPNALCEGSRTDWDIFLSRSDPWGYMGFYRAGGTFVPRFYLALSGGARSTDAITRVSTNQWYHVAGVYDGAKMKIYINGVEENSVSASGVTATTGDSLTIGDYHVDYHAVSPNAKMSNVKIYNRALSSQEIESLYVQGAANLGGVKTYRTSCKEILNAGESTGDGFYTIKPNSGGLSFQAYCDMTTDGGGWTLVLLNNKGLTSPTPVWDSAINDVNTTGSLNSNLTSFDLFLGVSYWKNLGSKMRLQIGSSPSSLTNKAIYSGFSFAGNYALTMSGETIVLGSGSPGMYTYHAANHFNLTTGDRDNDAYASGNCSTFYGNAPWWYGGCWSGSFWGYSPAEGSRWDGADGGTDQQWGSIWVGQ